MKQFIEQIAHPFFAVGSLVFLAVLFLGVIYWVYFRVPKEVHEEHARIPLNEKNSDQEKRKNANE